MEAVVNRPNPLTKWVIILSVLVVGQSVFILGNYFQINRRHVKYNAVLKTEFQKNEDTVVDLMKKGEYAAVLKITDGPIKDGSVDPYVYYYAGLAHYYLGQPQDALHDLQKAQFLAPKWNKELTQPFIENAQRALQAKKQ